MRPELAAAISSTYVDIRSGTTLRAFGNLIVLYFQTRLKAGEPTIFVSIKKLRSPSSPELELVGITLSCLPKRGGPSPLSTSMVFDG